MKKMKNNHTHIYIHLHTLDPERVRDSHTPGARSGGSFHWAARSSRQHTH